MNEENGRLDENELGAVAISVEYLTIWCIPRTLSNDGTDPQPVNEQCSDRFRSVSCRYEC